MAGAVVDSYSRWEVSAAHSDCYGSMSHHGIPKWTMTVAVMAMAVCGWPKNTQRIACSKGLALKVIHFVGGASHLESLPFLVLSITGCPHHPFNPSTQGATKAACRTLTTLIPASRWNQPQKMCCSAHFNREIRQKT